MSRCFHLFMSQQEVCRPPGAHWRIWGKSPPWQLCISEHLCITHFVSLLHMGLNSCWEMTGKQGEGKSQFSALCSSVQCSGNSPAATDMILLWKHTGKLSTVFGPLYVVWKLTFVYHCLSRVSALNAPLKTTGLAEAKCATLLPQGQTRSQMVACPGSAHLPPPNKEHDYRYSDHALVSNDPATPLREWTRAGNALDKRREMSAQPSVPPHRSKAVGCDVVKRAGILYWILTFINHTCLWVNSQLHRFNKRCAGRLRQSMCLIYTSVRGIIMEILTGRWTLITAQNKSRGGMKIDSRFSPSRLQVECGIETTPSVRTSLVILLLEGDSDYAG